MHTSKGASGGFAFCFSVPLRVPPRQQPCGMRDGFRGSCKSWSRTQGGLKVDRHGGMSKQFGTRSLKKDDVSQRPSEVSKPGR